MSECECMCVVCVCGWIWVWCVVCVLVSLCVLCVYCARRCAYGICGIGMRFYVLLSVFVNGFHASFQRFFVFTLVGTTCKRFVQLQHILYMSLRSNNNALIVVGGDSCINECKPIHYSATIWFTSNVVRWMLVRDY